MATDTTESLDATGLAPPAITMSSSGLQSLKLYKAEINTYLRALPKLLDDGYAGKHIVVKGEEILSVWDTQNDAIQAAREKFGPDAPIFVKSIDPRDTDRFARLKAQMGESCPF